MLVEVTDREAIATHCRKRPGVHAYLLGDLDDFFWPYTRWYAWSPGGAIEQLALVYGEPEPPVLLALGDPPLEDVGRLLAELAPTLPDRVYAHLTTVGLRALLDDFEAETAPAEHLKLALVDTDGLRSFANAGVELLGPSHLGELERLYDAAYPGTWFQPRMLETGRYLGIRDDGRLVCVAGVHVHSPRYGVAVLGNVATHPEARGRGLATMACGELCRLLLEDGIDTIALNVRSDNATAIGAYRRLGFEPVAEFVEVMLRRRHR